VRLERRVAAPILPLWVFTRRILLASSLVSVAVGATPSDGERHTAKTWADLSQGEIRVEGAAGQTVAANSAPAESFQTGTTNPCTDGPATDTAGAAVYQTEPAPDGGFTLAGAPTVIADLTVQGANDALLSRLYDVDPEAGTAKLIGRGVYRPTGVGTTSRQVFQLAPQAYRVAPGHVVKLELLAEDQPFMRKSTGQNAVGVSNLELRLPTADAAGAAAGLVAEPAAKVLPDGYTLAHDEQPEPVVPLPPAPPAPPAPPLPPALPPVLGTPTDPVPWQTVRTALRKRPSTVRIARNGSKVTFRETLPEAGRITYGISVRTRAGKGKRLRTTAIGQAKHVRTAPGTFKVTIKVSKRGRTLLRKHRKASVTLRSYFITPVEKRHVNTTRTLKRR
ncbi:MAG: hypothetical protein ITG02_03925, partial [Patulibacter sp.]|nr:hypothetical protein [Patulibacter sp.]